MAFTHLPLACSLLCMFFTITAYAGSPSYGYGPKPTNIASPPPPSHGYGPKPTNIPSPPPSQGYDPKPTNTASRPPPSHGYGPKPINIASPPPPSQGYNPKPTNIATDPPPSQGYDPKHDTEYTKPKPEEEERFTTMGVQGLVYCRSRSKFGPLEGAVVRITCLVTDGNGYELASLSLLSEATDKKGYFSTLALAELKKPGPKLSECKAFLSNSPLESCKVPTDVNNGLSGALLTSPRFLKDKKMKLYSVGPFFYTSQSHSTHNIPINNGY